MKHKNYPLYETTILTDFRSMTENVYNKCPDNVAYIYKKDPKDLECVNVTFREIREDIISLGTGLVGMGAREKHIALIGESSYEWIISYYSMMSIGSVSVPIDKELPKEDIKGIIEKGECSYVIYSSIIDDKMDEIKGELKDTDITFIRMGEAKEDLLSLSDVIVSGKTLRDGGDNSYFDYELDPSKLASIVFTSGTTGKGKGVMLSQTNILSDMTQGMYLFNITPKTMMVLPPHHTFGSTVVFVGHYSQGATVYLSNGLRYITKELKEQQPSHLVLVPLFVETFYKRIMSTIEKEGKMDAVKALIKTSNAMRKVGVDMRRKFFKSILDVFGGKVEFIICGGAALNQDIIDFFDAIGVPILNGYGITECAPLISCNRNKWQKNGSVGIPIIGEKVKILDPDENGEGEISVKGPNVMLGYYKDSEATKEAFDEEGYFKTGDYGKLDEDGWVYITGRLKNLIIFSNGKNVYPEEIETEISRIPFVNEVVVYAGESIAHPEKEVIVAEIYPDYDALKDHEIDDCKRYFQNEVKKINLRMVSYKNVGLVKLRKEEFEKNTSRKIVRFKIDKTID